MRKPIIVGNWKMNKTIAEAVEFIKAVDPVCHDGATYGVGTSFLALNEANKLAKNLIVAAENCHFEDSGAFTGEVSVPMLEEIGVKSFVFEKQKLCLMLENLKKLFVISLAEVLQTFALTV